MEHTQNDTNQNKTSAKKENGKVVINIKIKESVYTGIRSHWAYLFHFYFEKEKKERESVYRISLSLSLLTN